MADYTNSLGVNALTLDDINKQYGINATKEYAQQVAQKQLDTQLATLAQQGKTYEQNAYSESRKKDLDYFDQFRQSQYNTAGKGITGGMQGLGEQSLNLGRNSDLANIYNTLSQQKSGLDSQGNEYRTASNTYADQLYSDNLTKAQGLIDSDFNKRLSVAQQDWANKLAREQFEYEKMMASISGGSGGSGGSGRKSSGSSAKKLTAAQQADADWFRQTYSGFSNNSQKDGLYYQYRSELGGLGFSNAEINAMQTAYENNLSKTSEARRAVNPTPAKKATTKKFVINEKFPVINLSKKKK
jgi:hypothetical protein